MSIRLHPPRYSGYTLAMRMRHNGRSVRKSYKPKYERFYINPEFRDALGRWSRVKYEKEMNRPIDTLGDLL